jgi:hypothetical protein
LWYAEGDRVAVELRSVISKGTRAVAIPMWNHFRTALDIDNVDPFLSMVYRDLTPNALNKCAYRWHTGMRVWPGNHGVSENGAPVILTESNLRIRHFPYRSPEHMVRKALNGLQAYRATNLPAMLGAHWRQYGELIEKFGADQFIENVYMRHFYKVSPVDEGMVFDPAPYMRWEI